MVLDNAPERPEIVVCFRTDVLEQAEALHAFRAAFAGASDIEAVAPELVVLNIRPGACACGTEEAAA
jgi:hypothetical protein